MYSNSKVQFLFDTEALADALIDARLVRAKWYHACMGPRAMHSQALSQARQYSLWVYLGSSGGQTPSLVLQESAKLPPIQVPVNAITNVAITALPGGIPRVSLQLFNKMQPLQVVGLQAPELFRNTIVQLLNNPQHDLPPPVPQSWVKPTAQRGLAVSIPPSLDMPRVPLAHTQPHPNMDLSPSRLDPPYAGLSSWGADSIAAGTPARAVVGSPPSTSPFWQQAHGVAQSPAPMDFMNPLVQPRSWEPSRSPSDRYHHSHSFEAVKALSQGQGMAAVGPLTRALEQLTPRKKAAQAQQACAGSGGGTARVAHVVVLDSALADFFTSAGAPGLEQQPAAASGKTAAMPAVPVQRKASTLQSTKDVFSNPLYAGGTVALRVPGLTRHSDSHVTAPPPARARGPSRSEPGLPPAAPPAATGGQGGYGSGALQVGRQQVASRPPAHPLTSLELQRTSGSGNQQYARTSKGTGSRRADGSEDGGGSSVALSTEMASTWGSSVQSVAPSVDMRYAEQVARQVVEAMQQLAAQQRMEGPAMAAQAMAAALDAQARKVESSSVTMMGTASTRLQPAHPSPDSAATAPTRKPELLADVPTPAVSVPATEAATAQGAGAAASAPQQQTLSRQLSRLSSSTSTHGAAALTRASSSALATSGPSKQASVQPLRGASSIQVPSTTAASPSSVALQPHSSHNSQHAPSPNSVTRHASAPLPQHQSAGAPAQLSPSRRPSQQLASSQHQFELASESSECSGWSTPAGGASPRGNMQNSKRHRARMYQAVHLDMDTRPAGTARGGRGDDRSVHSTAGIQHQAQRMGAGAGGVTRGVMPKSAQALHRDAANGGCVNSPRKPSPMSGDGRVSNTASLRLRNSPGAEGRRAPPLGEQDMLRAAANTLARHW